MQAEIRQALYEAAEPSYRDFSAKLLPGVDQLLGVRLPILRCLAQRIVLKDWRAYLDFMPQYFEEVMLQGMVIGYVNVDYADRVELIAAFVPKIDNWSVCDSFCCGLKFTAYHRDVMWDLLKEYSLDQRQYYSRFGVVMLLSYYIAEEYIDKVLAVLGNIETDAYYVKMAVAWAVSICYIKFPGKTTVFLQTNVLDNFTHQKSLQKIIESRRLSAAAKAMVRRLKR